MKIAVVGAGHVGSALARLWAARRHDVTVGTRRDGRNDLPVAVRVSGVAEACIDAEVVALCVPWAAVDDAIAAIGPLSGKIIVDATNPLLPDGSGLELGTTTSAAEEIAKKLPEAKVVKAFNTIGSYLLGDADFGWLRADGYYCGDDAKAKRIVHSLIEDGGLEPVDTGPLSMARMLEPLAVLWINLLYRQGRPKDFAFKLLHREPGS
jgi:predicted dinucleotide-binding enzyme